MRCTRCARIDGARRVAAFFQGKGRSSCNLHPAWVRDKLPFILFFVATLRIPGPRTFRANRQGTLVDLANLVVVGRPSSFPPSSFFLFPSRAHTSLSAQLVVLTCRSAKSAVNFLQHAEFPLENAVTLNGGVLARGNTIFPCLRYFPTIPPPLNIPPPFLQRSITRNGMELATEKKKQKFLPFSSPTRKEQRYHLLSSESQREKKRRKKGRKYRWLVRSIREKIRADRCARVIINTRVKLINRANAENGTRMRNEGMKYVCSLLPSPRGSTHGTERRRQSWRRCFAMPSVG